MSVKIHINVRLFPTQRKTWKTVIDSLRRSVFGVSAKKSPSWRKESRNTMTGKAGKEQSRKPAKSYDAAPIHQRRGGGRIDHGRRNAPFVRAHTIRNIGRFSSEKKDSQGNLVSRSRPFWGFACLPCESSPSRNGGWTTSHDALRPRQARGLP